MLVDAPDRGKALVADDSTVNRLTLRGILEERGYEVLDAATGVEAVGQFRAHEIEVVFMDIIMPEMDGMEATRIIKDLCGDRFVPVIVITALEGNDAHARCMEAGADDFLTKPFEHRMLGVKLKVMERIRGLHNTIWGQHDRLRANQAQMVTEQEIAEGVLGRATRTAALDARNLHHSMSPAALFSGDVVMAGWTPTGAQRVLLGDVTGHGLAAAVCTLPAAEVFHSLTRRGSTLGETVGALNRRLAEIIPEGVFMAICAVELDWELRSVLAWNGGLPPAHLVRPGQGVVTTFESDHPPLGVLGPEEFRSRPKRRAFHPGDRITIYSDGLIEFPDTSLDGEQMFIDIISELEEEENLFALVQRELAIAWGDAKTHDDSTLVVLDCVRETALGQVGDENAIATTGVPITSASQRVRYDQDTLRLHDPLGLLCPWIEATVPARDWQRDSLMVLGELLSNAVDHGVLGISSKVKFEDDGMALYERQKSDALSALVSGSVLVELDFESADDMSILRLSVEDSGDGFDRASVPSPDPTLPYGRGLSLVEEMCDSVRYLNDGRRVEGVLEWSRP